MKLSIDVLSRPIVFDHPDRLVDPAAWVSHIPFAFWIIDAHRPKLLVELGTHSGNSYCAFAQAVDRLRLDTKCFAIDTWCGDPHAGYYGEEVFDDLSRHHDARYSRFSRLVRSTFDEAQQYFEPRSIDLLHIDGHHTYEAVQHDFQYWLDKMSPRGVILLHDTNVRENQFGVWKLWADLSTQYPHFQFTHGHGLGVLGVGEKLGAPLRWLFERGDARANDEAGQCAHMFFERLGVGLISRLALSQSEATAEVSRTSLERERDRIAKHCEVIQSEYDARGDRIQELEDIVRTLTSDHTKVTLDRQAIKQENDARGDRIQELEGVVRTLASDNSQIGRQYEASKQENDASKAEIEELNKKIDTFSGRREEMAREHEAIARQLGRVEKENDQLKEQIARFTLERDTERQAANQAYAALAHSERMWRSACVRAIDEQHVAGQAIANTGTRGFLHCLFEILRGVRLGSRSWVQYVGDRPALVRLLVALRYPFSFRKRARKYDDLVPLAAVLPDLKLIFDESWYVQQNPDVRSYDRGGLAHYLDHGWQERRDPSPLFDADYYCAAIPTRTQGRDALVVFLQTEVSQARHFHPLFDVDYYSQQAAAAGLPINKNPLVHYLTVGKVAQLSPHPLFDHAGYTTAIPELQSGHIDPLRFYLKGGHRSNVSPHALFDHAWYRNNNPDVPVSIPPLVHYLAYGSWEGRTPNATFNAREYLRHYPGISKIGIEPLIHYALSKGSENSGANNSAAEPPAPSLSAELPAVQANYFNALKGEVETLRQTLTYHANRIDYALGIGEGVTALNTEIASVRASNEFWEPFRRTTPLVSVCVATNNRAALLIDRCIRSLQAQTYKNLQIIVVGDHCTDDTAYQIARLRDDRIVFENLPHRGPYPREARARWQVAGSNAMNRALDLAEGDFVAHLDDDDEATVDRIEEMLRHAQANNAEFCWHPFWYEQSDGTWVRLGNGQFALGQITTGSIFYHRYYAKIKWDVRAYELDEPGDWNRLRKIKLLRPRTAFLEKPLMFHYKEMNQGSFEPQAGEGFLN